MGLVATATVVWGFDLTRPTHFSDNPPLTLQHRSGFDIENNFKIPLYRMNKSMSFKDKK